MAERKSLLKPLIQIKNPSLQKNETDFYFIYKSWWKQSIRCFRNKWMIRLQSRSLHSLFHLKTLPLWELFFLSYYWNLLFLLLCGLRIFSWCCFSFLYGETGKCYRKPILLRSELLLPRSLLVLLRWQLLFLGYTTPINTLDNVF